MNEIIELQKPILNKNAKSLVQYLLSGRVGTRLDFFDYDLTESDLLIITDILCQAINKTFETYELLDEDILLFNNFYKELELIKKQIQKAGP